MKCDLVAARRLRPKNPVQIWIFSKLVYDDEEDIYWGVHLTSLWQPKDDVVDILHEF